MEKSLKYLHTLYRDDNFAEHRHRIALIGQKLSLVRQGWTKVFGERIFDDPSLIEMLMISNLCLLTSAIDILQGWGIPQPTKHKRSSDIQLKTGGTLELLRRIRNCLIHEESPFPMPIIQGNNGYIDSISYLLPKDIEDKEFLQKRFGEWIENYKMNNHEDWMDDDYYENFFNDELYQALTIKSDTLISIDIEMYDILVQIFSNTQKYFPNT
ncbi:hypothetical protein HG442_000055 [Candidatus Gracilibacteria bacterium]|nr:hypothetical protein [Candidatus Gracilibacteria bacterium]